MKHATAHLHPHLTLAPPAPDLSQRLTVLGEIVEGLIERTDLLEEQRAMLISKVDLLQRRIG